MFNPRAYANSRPDGIGVLEVAAADPGQPRLFVPLKRTELRGEVVGPLAALRLTQVYGYTRAQSDQVLEAVYRFPLPGDAAVTGVVVRFGDVEIRAGLAAREQAEADYQAAKAAGQQAALLTRESPDVFTLQVAGLRPDQGVVVETSYVQLARAEGAGWSLRVPLTTAPRYVRSDEVTGRHARGQPLLLLRDPGHRFRLDLTVVGAGAVASPTHPLDVAAEGDRARVRLAGGEALPDRDCVLTWQPRQAERRPVLQVALHDDAAAGYVYFLAMVAPPAAPDAAPAVGREVTLLVDHSGSMEGPKWAAADWAVKQFLAGLTDRDAFDLGLFHNDTRWLARAPLKADAAAVAGAVRFLEGHRDSGGTELGVALEQALGLRRTRGALARHLLVVTDAEVTDAGRILRLAEDESRRGDRRRISVLCIDAAPNAYLATQLAERGGGVARFLTSSPEEDDISTALDELLADWAQPVVAGLGLEVGAAAQAAGREVRGGARSIVDLGDLPSGRPAWVVGRAPRAAAPPSFRATAADNRELAAAPSDLAFGDHAAIKALFGAWRVAGLEYLVHSGLEGDELRAQLGRLGYDPESALTGEAGPRRVYAENARRDAAAALRDLLVREALDYGLACSETAFVATRTEAGQRVAGTVAVANALPAGWAESFAAAGPAPLAMASPPPGSTGSSPPSFLRSSRSARRMLGPSAPPATPPGPAYATAGSPRSDVFYMAGPQPPGAADAVDSGGVGALVFAGVPALAGGRATLFDSSRPADGGKLPPEFTLSRLRVSFPSGAPATLAPGLALLVYVGDLATPRARVRLADLVRQGGERPLNLRRLAGQVVQIVLVDPAGAWAGGAPRLEVAL